MVAGETVGRTDADGGHDREREWGRVKGGSFDLHGGREGRRQSRSHPFAASVVLAAEEREMKIVGEKSAIRPSRLRPRRTCTRQRMKPLLKQTAGFTIALERRIV